MPKHISYGIIPIFASEHGVKEYLIVQSVSGFWGFPKGHPEIDETSEESAIREAHEETGISVSKDDLGSPVHYDYEQSIKGEIQTKRVVLFPVFVSSIEVTMQIEEIAGYDWVSVDKAISSINLSTISEPLMRVENGMG